HVRTAEEIARYLGGHPAVARIVYPGLPGHPQADLARRQMKAGGSVIACWLKRGRAATFDFMNRLQLIGISNNLGDAKSLATHPATSTHSRLAEAEREALGITDGLVRLSIGLEDTADLVADLDRALQ